jgi:hypothetical protein
LQQHGRRPERKHQHRHEKAREAALDPDHGAF